MRELLRLGDLQTQPPSAVLAWPLWGGRREQCPDHTRGDAGWAPSSGEGYRAPLSDPLHITGLFLPRQNPACQS